MNSAVKHLLVGILWTSFGLFLESKAQNFGQLGTEWYYSGHNAAAPAYAGYFRFKSVQDTTIQNRISHTLLQRHYDYNGNMSEEARHYFSQENDTLFYYSPGQSRFQVFFVYNREKGDTLTLDFPDSLPGFHAPYRLVIDTVFSEIVDGIPLKKYKTSSLDWATFAGAGYFMDRIGGISWFFPTYTIGIPEGPGAVRCYADAVIDTNFNTYACDYRLQSSVSSPGDKLDVQIYPNPTSGRLFIESKGAGARVQVYDLTGKLVLVSTKENSLDIAAFSNGCYWLKVQFEAGQEVWRKVIKW